MEKIASKQIDGIVDLNSYQSIPARKQFEGGVGAGHGPTGHYPLLSGGYIYWVINPGTQPQQGDYRMGISPNTNLFTLQKMQGDSWVSACLDGCSSSSSSGGGDTPPTDTGGGGGSDGGCLLYGTQILLSNGSTKNIEDLEIGDLVKTVAIAGLNSEIETAWKTFSSNQFSPTEESSVVVGIQKSQFSFYFLINEQLKITFEHPVFISRNNVYAFLRANDLVMGDKIFHYTLGWQEVISKERIDQTVNVVNINVESQDTYFADSFLVHNLIDPNLEKTIL